MTREEIDLYEIIQAYPNFPKQGILFRDINPVFRSNDAMNFVCSEIYRRFKNIKIDCIAGIESRGFVLSSVVAMKLGKGMIMIRKAGKLPGETIGKSYNIEYGNAIMEIQKNSIERGQNILIADDLIATGGTAMAAAYLIEELGGIVAGFAFVVELADLNGATLLRNKGYKVHSLVVYN